MVHVRVINVSETVIFARENGVRRVSKAQNGLASQGRRLKAGAAKAPRGRRGQDFTVPGKTAPLYEERPQIQFPTILKSLTVF